MAFSPSPMHLSGEGLCHEFVKRSPMTRPTCGTRLVEGRWFENRNCLIYEVVVGLRTEIKIQV